VDLPVEGLAAGRAAAEVVEEDVAGAGMNGQMCVGLGLERDALLHEYGAIEVREADYLPLGVDVGCVYALH